MQTEADQAVPVTVLLVEDNPPEVHLVEEILRDVAAPIALHVVHDGAAALEFVRRTGAFTTVARPGLILLDLNLPKVDGRDVLAALKGDPELRAIPIIVLSVSTDPADVAGCYALGANAFVTKPVGLGDFFQAVRAIDAFWLRTTSLPGRAAVARTAAGK